MSDRFWTVSQLLMYLKNRLNSDQYLKSVHLKGEISNFSASFSRHLYFTLKDEEAAISCVMFASNAQRLREMPHDGQKVAASGSLSVYEKQGRLQLIVTSLQDDGAGELMRRYEELKKKLLEEGYFAPEHKKTLPPYPFSIGLITGENTAAGSDVHTTLMRRWPVAKVTEYNCLVQGEAAPAQIVQKIKEADENGHDLIILARGGGSLEDLWAFNEEIVVKAIYACKTPLITGIGHEVDFTLADFAADVRANTPTGAAELATPVYAEVLAELNNRRDKMTRILRQRILEETRLLQYLKEGKLRKIRSLLIDDNGMKLVMFSEILSRFPAQLEKRRLKADVLRQNLLSFRFRLIEGSRDRISGLRKNMEQSIRILEDGQRRELLRLQHLLKAYDIQNTLERGFALVENRGKSIRDVKEIQIKDTLDIRLAKGRLQAEVVDKEETDG